MENYICVYFDELCSLYNICGADCRRSKLVIVLYTLYSLISYLDLLKQQDLKTTASSMNSWFF